MVAGTKKQRIANFRWALLAALLVCAGCNLDFTPQVASPSFEGPPEVTIASPLTNQTFMVGATVIVQARVENAGPDLARIAVLLDGALLGERLNPNEINAAVLPLTIDWPTSNAGKYDISVIAERGDGTSAQDDVSIMVISQAPVEQESTTDDTGEQSNAPEPTSPPPSEPTAAANEESAPSDANDNTTTQPTATQIPPPAIGESQVQGLVHNGGILRRGPSTAFEPPEGSLPAGQEVTIVAVNPTRDWYRIKYNELGEAWIWYELVTPAGEITGLPVETGPPLPIEQGVNLIVVSVQLPAQVVCLESTTVTATIRNSGTLAAQTSPWVVAEAILLDTGQVLNQDAQPAFLDALDVGAEQTIEIPIVVSAHFSEGQQIRVTVDSGNHIEETDEGDNTGTSDPYTLQKGNCG